jgi:hypothetical protein
MLKDRASDGQIDCLIPKGERFCIGCLFGLRPIPDQYVVVDVYRHNQRPRYPDLGQLINQICNACS